MILRRYYDRRKKYDYYFHPEIKSYSELCEFAKSHPNVEVFKIDNAEYCIYDLSHEEQEIFWKQTTSLIYNHTRWVLDNLEKLPEFKVRWNYYGKNRKTVGKPSYL